jgi:hypothetical protein
MMDKNQDVSVTDIYAMLAGELLPSDIHKQREERQRARAIGKRQCEIEVELQKFSTRKLLAMRQEYYSGDAVWESDGAYYKDDGYHTSKAITANEYDDYLARRYALYAILDRRPHVPNKAEGQALRKAAATAHHGPKKRGGRVFKLGDGIALKRGGRSR